MEEILKHPMVITGFFIYIIIALLYDQGYLNKKSHVVSLKEAIWSSIFWIGSAMIFSGVIFYVYSQDSAEIGMEKFLQFQSAYWIEKALSADNLFVFILIFKQFGVADSVKHKVLTWGILGAVLLRGIFIFVGVGLINLTYLPSFHLFGEDVRINVVLSIFGAWLLWMGLKTGLDKLRDSEDDEDDYKESFAVRVTNKLFKGRVLSGYEGDKFFVEKLTTGGKVVKYATQLLVVVVVIELADLVFALDSIPAIFAISEDPVILFTSNIFAILGLRALFFILDRFVALFRYLPYGLAFILSFIGLKMIVSPIYHIGSSTSLTLVGSMLVLSILASVIHNKMDESKAGEI